MTSSLERDRNELDKSDRLALLKCPIEEVKGEINRSMKQAKTSNAPLLEINEGPDLERIDDDEVLDFMAADSASKTSPVEMAAEEPVADMTPVGNGADPTSNHGKGEEEAEDNSNHVHRTSKDYYFDSYSHHGIHEEMLKDEVRTKTYQMAIMNNSHLFRDKVVLDVGCGTGILSMFAVQAGAAIVYGVDCSSIIHQARQIVEKNGFKDKIVLIQGKMEEIELPVNKVDIIISEWMGYFLLYESMLDTVLFARDKYLVKDGIIFPDKAIMYVCGMEDAQMKNDRIHFWENVYGFDMSVIKEIALSEPIVDVVDCNTVMTNTVPILKLDLLTCTKEHLSFSSDFVLTSNRNDYMHGIVAYFECAFTQVHKPMGWSTSPFSKYTHWKQTIFYLRETIVICQAERITGKMTCSPNKKNPRDLDINLQIKFDGTHCKLDCSHDYRLR